MTADDVRGKQLPSGDDGPRYDKKQVAAFLDAAGIRLAAMEADVVACRRTGQTDHWLAMPFSPGGPSGPTQRDFHPPPFGRRAMTQRRWTPCGKDFATRFLGSGNPRDADDLRGKQFSTHRPGYDKKQVDAFLETAAWRLAAMESTEAMESRGMESTRRRSAIEWSPPPWRNPRWTRCR